MAGAGSSGRYQVEEGRGAEKDVETPMSAIDGASCNASLSRSSSGASLSSSSSSDAFEPRMRTPRNGPRTASAPLLNCLPGTPPLLQLPPPQSPTGGGSYVRGGGSFQEIERGARRVRHMSVTESYGNLQAAKKRVLAQVSTLHGAV